MGCLSEPLDSNREKWSGRVLDPVTGECRCQSGFEDIGSKDCYNRDYGKEIAIRPLRCSRSQFFSYETLRCEDCDSSC